MTMSDLPRFRGFRYPYYTQVPNEILDELLPDLTGAELKVLLYIVRRTFGFQKDADAIGLKQLVQGIRTRDGRQQDRGTGLAESSVIRARDGLLEKGIIVAERRGSKAHGDETTVYSLRFADAAPVSENASPPTRILQVPGLAVSGTQNIAESIDKNGSDENRRAALKADLRARLKRWHLAATPRHEKSLLGLWLAADDPHAFAARLEYAAIGAQDAAEVLGRLTSVPRRY
jgi:hypothetical protein